MTCLRACLVWLALLALPLQGFAAASMLFCGAGGTGPISSGQVAKAHISDGAHHHHGDHGQSGHHPAGAQADSADAPAQPAGPGDAGHRCGVCASCCNLAAIASFLPLIQPGAGPPADLPPVVLRVATRVALLPDKPPRA
jgi:hypothetical protein